VDQWTKRFQEAERLVDDVAEGIAERDAVPP
jgi:syntaxin of plants SYP5